MLKIAIIDDNEAWCFALANFLQQHGFDVSAFDDPYIFLPQAKQFNLALIDFSIPPKRYQKEMQGPELIAQLKTELVNPPSLILLSAYFTEDILKESHRFFPHADAYLSKSIGLAGILQAVEQLATAKSIR